MPKAENKPPPPPGKEYNAEGKLVFAKGNDLSAKGGAKSLGREMHHAFRERIGVKGILKIADEAMSIAMMPGLDPKERLKAMELVLKYAIPAAQLQSAELTEKPDGTRSVKFVVVNADGVETTLLGTQGDDDGDG